MFSALPVFYTSALNNQTVVTMDVPGRYTVTWNVDGKKTEVEYFAGEAIAKPAAPSKKGFVFEGWQPQIPATMPSRNLTFTAVFAPLVKVDDIRISIGGNPGTMKINFREKMLLTAAVNELPEGAKIVWYQNDKEVKTEKANKTTSEYKTDELRSDVTISVKLVDADGIIIKYTNGKEILDSEKITVKASFFRKIIAFIKIVIFRIETVKTNA